MISSENTRSKLRDILSVMLPIFVTQLAVMGMSFFDKVSKAASAVGEAAKEQQRRKQEMIARLESKSDDQLKKIIKDDSFFGSTDTEKNIARKILRNRGYQKMAELAAFVVKLMIYGALLLAGPIGWVILYFLLKRDSRQSSTSEQNYWY